MRKPINHPKSLSKHLPSSYRWIDCSNVKATPSHLIRAVFHTKGTWYFKKSITALRPFTNLWAGKMNLEQQPWLSIVCTPTTCIFGHRFLEKLDTHTDTQPFLCTNVLLPMHHFRNWFSQVSTACFALSALSLRTGQPWTGSLQCQMCR